MTEFNDYELLGQFARGGSEAAFAEVVSRYVGLVHSTAFRVTGNAHHSEEITQAVFIILARKAGKLSPKVVLSGWLYKTARLVAANFMKAEVRRQLREQEAYMQSIEQETDSQAWEKISPWLDEAMGALNETDRDAVVLRYFENKTSAEIGAALRMTEETARKRVNRALEKLRNHFIKRGIALTTGAIAAAVATNSVQAAPAGLSQVVSTVAAVKGATATTSTLTLIKGALKIMAWTKVKTAAVIGATLLLTAGTTIAIHQHNKANESIFTSTRELSPVEIESYDRSTGQTPNQVASAFFEACAKEDWTEALKYWHEPAKAGQEPASVINEGFKSRYGGLKVISVGKPFTAKISIATLVKLQPESRKQYPGDPKGEIQLSGVFVPYKMRLKDGSTRIWQLSLKCDNPEKRWMFAGGM